jgi:hypothetical protein
MVENKGQIKRTWSRTVLQYVRPGEYVLFGSSDGLRNMGREKLDVVLAAATIILLH